MSTEIEKSNFPFFEVKQGFHGNYNLAQIEFRDYSDVGCKLRSLLEVCRVALLNDTEKMDTIHIAEVLGLAKELIPHEELDLLDKLHEEAFKQDLKEV